MPCAELSFQQIARSHFDLIAARARSVGLPITGLAGESEAAGFRLRWEYDEPTGRLRIQCVQSPMLVPCAVINGKIASLVEQTRRG